MTPYNFLIRLKNDTHARWILLIIGVIFVSSILFGMSVRFLPVDYMVLLIGGLIFTYLVFFKIEFAIIAALFIQNQLSRFNYMGQGTPYHPNGLMGVMLVAGAVIYFLFTRIDVSRFRAMGGFAGFFLVAIISVMVTFFVNKPHFMDGFTILLRLAAAFAIYAVLIHKLDSISKIKWVIAAVLAAQILPVINGLLLYAGTTGLTFTDETMRLGNSGMGVYLSEVTIFCLIFFLDSKKLLPRLLFGGLTALFGAGLFYSFGRSGWIGFVFALAILGLLQRRWILLILPILLVLAVLLVPGISQRFSDVMSDSQAGGGTNTFLGRVGYWQAALEVYKTHLMGVGFGIGSYYVGEYVGTGSHMVHNDYISVLLETGFAGLILFLIWQAQWLTSLYNDFRQAERSFETTFSMAILALFSASLIMRITDNIVLDSYDMYPLCALVASVLAIPRIRAEQASKTDQAVSSVAGELQP